MIGPIVRHELRLLGADRSAWIAAGILCLTAAYGLWNGRSWVRYQAEGARAAIADEERTFQELEEKARNAGDTPGLAPPFGPFSPGMVGLFYPRVAYLPHGPLEILSIGQSDIYPRFFKVSGERRDAFADSQEIDNPLNMLSGRFDLAFVVVYLLPLVIITLSYGILAGERESGTLTLTLSQGVRLPTVLMGKILARCVIAVAPLAAITVAISALMGARWTVSSLVLWMACITAYSAFWLILCAVVNTTGWNSCTNAVVLAGAWLSVVLVVPALLNVTAKALHPVPSRAEMIQRTRELQTATRRPVELLEQYYREHPEHLPEGVDIRKYNFPLQWTILQIEMDKGMVPLLDAVDRGLERQHALLTKVGFVSPALAVQNALNDLAGTGLARQRHFWRQVITFHQEHRQFFAPKTFAHVKLRVDDYSRMPRFRFQEEASSKATWRVAGSLSVVAAATALMLVWFKVRLSTCPVVA